MERLYRFAQIICLDDVSALRQEWERAIAAAGGNSEAAAETVLALNEAAVNSLRHGYQGRPGWLQIEIWRDGRSLLVKQGDAAPSFDPTGVPPPDTTQPLTSRPLGGMGVHMIRHFTDELHYELTGDGRNQLIFIKHNVFD